MTIESSAQIAVSLVVCNLIAAAAVRRSFHSISLFSCDPRQGAKLGLGPESKWFWPGHDAQHRGSELNDGTRSNTSSDRECADLCRQTEGCRVWSRFQEDSNNQWNSPGACWIKSSVPYPKPNAMLNTGVIPPKDLGGACRAMNATGFRHAIPYSDPKLLFASSAFECCGRCHEHNEYSLPDECPSETSGIAYIGVKSLTSDGSLLTNTSKECCKICARVQECKSWTWMEDFTCTLNGDIPSKSSEVNGFGGVAKPKVCNPEVCTLDENVDILGENLVDTKSTTPFGRDLIVDSPEQCCLRCQEHPAGPNGVSTGCWLKRGTSRKAQVGNCTWTCISGVIRSRIKASDWELYRSALQQAHPPRETSDSDSLTLIVVLPTVGILFALCGGAVCLMVRDQRRKKFIWKSRTKDGDQLRQLTAAATHSSPSDKDQIHQENVAPLRSTGTIALSESSMAPSSIALSSIASLPSEDRAQQLARLRSQMARFRNSKAGLEYAPGSSDTDSDPAEMLPAFVEGDSFQGKFIVEVGKIITKTSIIHFARSKFDRARPVVIKLYKKHACFKRELKFFELQLRSNDIPQVIDVVDTDEALVLNERLPAIIFERGDYTLGAYLQRRTRALDFMDQRNILFKLSSTLHFLHTHKIVHRDVKPGNAVMFSSDLTWKLIDFECWAFSGEDVPIKYTLRYACPEVLSAHSQGLDVIQANPAMDMWGLGLIFWEVMAGEPLFVDTIRDDQVVAMLLGIEPLPFENNKVLWEKIQSTPARRIIRNLLKRQPNVRWPIQKVITHAFFDSGKDTIEAGEGVSSAVQAVAKHIGRIKEKIMNLQEVAVEHLKQTTSNVLIISINFHEIDETSEFLKLHPTGILERYIQGDLKVEEPLFQPNYSLFKHAEEDPCALLRLEKVHVLAVAFVNGGGTKTDVAVTGVEFVRVEVTEMKEDVQGLVFCTCPTERHVFELVAFWDTRAHTDVTFHMKGAASVDVVLGIRIKGSDDVMVVRKTIDLKMHAPKEKFTLVKKYIRTLEWYSKLPQSTKVYLNGALQVVQLVTKFH